jgi:hypothetical protein
MELKQNNIYIFTEKRTSFPKPFKGKIIELTKTTIYIENLDSNIKYRKTLELFNKDLEPIELIYNSNEYIKNNNPSSTLLTLIEFQYNNVIKKYKI